MQDKTLPPAATEPHPLDDFEFGKADVVDNSRTQAHQPLLRWSVIVAAVAFGVIFISSILGNNSSFNSILQRGCETVRGFGAIVMLVACGGILFAYRLPHMDVNRMKSGAIAAKGWLANGLVTLGLLNLILVLAVCGGAFLLGGVVGWVYVSGELLFGVCFAGVATTMVVTHTGYLRAYGIGVVTVLLPLCIYATSIVLMYPPVQTGGGWRGGTAPMLDQTLLRLTVLLTLACGVGMVCASYAAAVDWVRTRRALPRQQV